MNTLILKLPSIVSDNNLPKLGEFKVAFAARGTKAATTRIQFISTAAVTLQILGGTFHTDPAGTSTPVTSVTSTVGNVVIYFKATDATGSITFKDKKNISQLGISGNDFVGGSADQENSPYVILDIKDIPKQITQFNSAASNSATILVGDISLLKNLTALTVFKVGTLNAGIIPKFKLSGTLTFLPKTLKNFAITVNSIDYNFNIDLAAFNGCTELLTIEIYGGKVQGSINNLSTLPKLVTYFINSSNDISTGVLSSLSGLTALRIFQSRSTKFTGGLNDFPATIEGVNMINPNLSASYTSRSWGSSLQFLQIKDVPLSALSGDLLISDIMSVTSWTSTKTVALKARTTASNQNVASLANIGVTVTAALLT